MTVLADPALVDYIRDRWGRPLIVPPDGGKPVPYVRSSSAAKTVEDTYNLELWARRNVTYGMAHDASLVARQLAVPGHPTTWSDEQRQAVNKIHQDAAAVALAHRGADIGTALHTMTERTDRGEQFDAGIYTADIEAYVNALIAAGFSVDPLLIECRLVCDELQMAGTADRILTRTSDRMRLIADIKTGKDVAYGGLGWAAQLACYAHGSFYDVMAGKRIETPALDRTTGIIIHLPAGQGRCDLYEIDLVAGFRAAQLANEIRAVRLASRRWISPLATVPPEASVVPLERRTMIPLPRIADRRTRLLERYHKLHPTQAAKFRDRRIDRDDLDGIEAALDELTKPRQVTDGRLRSQAVSKLTERALTLSAADHAVLDAIAAEALNGPGPISYTFEPHGRNLAVCRALVTMCEKGWDEDRFRSLIGCAVNDKHAESPVTPVAEWLALMSTEEAAALDGLVAAIGG